MNPTPAALAALVLVGCAPKQDVRDVYSASMDDLARLDALQVVDVGQLIAEEPANDMSCYGPCPGQDVDQDFAAQAERLRALADVAEPAAAAEPATCDVDVEAQLAALRGLQIVEIRELLLEEAQGEATCYGLPCADEQARVDEGNCAQIGRLVNIVEASKDL